MKGVLILTIVIFALVTPAFAEPEFLDVTVTRHKIGDDSKLAEKSCAICHVSDSDYSLNAYGKEVDHALVETNAKTLSVAILDKIAPLDSDKDGTSNEEEFAADTLPGDAKSGGKPGAAATEEPSTTVEEEAKPFPPKNGFHPAIVHFPIALFLLGLLLDFVGMVRNERTLLFAGWYNLVFAAITSLFAVASGLLAMTLTRLPYKGLIYSHLLYAIATTVVIWLMVALRVHRHEKMNIPIRAVYYLLAIAGGVLISWTGHLGGLFVYGE